MKLENLEIDELFKKAFTKYLIDHGIEPVAERSPNVSGGSVTVKLGIRGPWPRMLFRVNPNNTVDATTYELKEGDRPGYGSLVGNTVLKVDLNDPNSFAKLLDVLQTEKARLA